MTPTTRLATIALAPLAITMLLNANRPQQPTTAIPVSRALSERQAAKVLAAQYNKLVVAMLKLPAAQRAAFIATAPGQHRASLIMRSIEANIVCRKPAPATYSNKYGKKSTATVASTKPNDQRESLSFKQLQIASKSAAPSLPTSQIATERIGDEKVLAAIARRSHEKNLQYAEVWKQKAHALAQTMPTINAEKSINLSNTNATVGKRSAGRNAYSASSSKTRSKR